MAKGWTREEMDSLTVGSIVRVKQGLGFYQPWHRLLLGKICWVRSVFEFDVSFVCAEIQLETKEYRVFTCSKAMVLEYFELVKIRTITEQTIVQSSVWDFAVPFIGLRALITQRPGFESYPVYRGTSFMRHIDKKELLTSYIPREQ